MKDLLKMYKEDLLRAILEFGKSGGILGVNILLEDLVDEKDLFDKAVMELEEAGLIIRKGANIMLTPAGREDAESIYTKHKHIEDYFREVFKEKEVHLLAHALEHCVSDSLLAKMKGELALVREKSNLSELLPEDEATVLAVSVSDKKLFSRILGLGLFPGSKIKVFEKNRNQMVIEVEGRKIALDDSIADKVLTSKEKGR